MSANAAKIIEHKELIEQLKVEVKLYGVLFLICVIITNEWLFCAHQILNEKKQIVKLIFAKKLYLLLNIRRR